MNWANYYLVREYMRSHPDEFAWTGLGTWDPHNWYTNRHSFIGIVDIVNNNWNSKRRLHASKEAAKFLGISIMELYKIDKFRRPSQFTEFEIEVYEREFIERRKQWLQQQRQNLVIRSQLINQTGQRTLLQVRRRTVVSLATMISKLLVSMKYVTSLIL